MREIKFRGKRVDNKDWVYGDYYDESHINNNTKIVIIPKDKTLGFEVDPKTIGQYTGRKDKNGKEIYGGHIYDIGICTKIIRPDHFIEDTYELMKLIEDGAVAEIVGDIYQGQYHNDNPELPEGK